MRKRSVIRFLEYRSALACISSSAIEGFLYVEGQAVKLLLSSVGKCFAHIHDAMVEQTIVSL